MRHICREFSSEVFPLDAFRLIEDHNNRANHFLLIVIIGRVCDQLVRPVLSLQGQFFFLPAQYLEDRLAKISGAVQPKDAS